MTRVSQRFFCEKWVVKYFRWYKNETVINIIRECWSRTKCTWMGMNSDRLRTVQMTGIWLWKLIIYKLLYRINQIVPEIEVGYRIQFRRGEEEYYSNIGCRYFSGAQIKIGKLKICLRGRCCFANFPKFYQMIIPHHFERRLLSQPEKMSISHRCRTYEWIIKK